MKKYCHSPDKILFLLTCGLVIFGVIMVYDASAMMAERRFNDSTLFFEETASLGYSGIVLNGMYKRNRLQYFPRDFSLYITWFFFSVTNGFNHR